MMARLRNNHQKEANDKLTRNGIRDHRGKMSSSDDYLLNERSKLVLWRSPFRTTFYCCLEFLCLFRELLIKLLKNWKSVVLFVVSILLLCAVYYMEGTHQPIISAMEKRVLWWSYWVGLGILSSVGLGTGLHTFLLYLGPHIASVTLAAFECMSVDFPEPPYPEKIICPADAGDSMSLWTIVSKVRIEAMMWGAGTAIGELPPYFMARAARLSGRVDEEEEELEALLSEDAAQQLGVLDRAKLTVHKMVKRAGFWGILLCASIPNPLFDLAGITCGHFLIPFWTFFGATLIGKAIVKMHIQKLFVIFTFSEDHVEHVVGLLAKLPWFGDSLQRPFKDWLTKQKEKWHVEAGSAVASEPSLLSQAFEWLVMAMVVFFLVSIVNSMAQKYHKRFTSDRVKASQD